MHARLEAGDLLTPADTGFGAESGGSTTGLEKFGRNCAIRLEGCSVMRIGWPKGGSQSTPAIQES